MRRLIRDAETNHKRALPPMRPTVFKFPSLAIPTTNVENTSGAIIICTSLKKIVVSNFMFSEKEIIKEEDDFSCTMYPNNMPAIIAIRI